MNQTPLGTAALPIVLVASAQDPPAIVTRLCVFAFRSVDKDTTPLQIEGGDWLDEQTNKRWLGGLIPHVREGLRQLGIQDAGTICWRISLRVPDAVALSGRPCRLEGTSADAVCMVVLIASALGIKTRADTLLTGAVQLDDQRLGLVGMLPDKLVAAASDPSIRRFIHPPIDQDGSGAWTAEAITAWAEACHYCDHRVKHIACTQIAKAVKATLSRDSYVIAAIRLGLLNASAVEGGPEWVNELRQVHDAIWLKCLDRRIHTGRKPAVQQLLEARLQRAVEESSYPTGIGASVQASLRTVPLGRRRCKLNGLLISSRLLQDISQLAEADNTEDLELLTTATGHGIGHSKSSPDSGAMHGDEARPEAGATPEESLAWLIEHRSETEAAQRIDRQLDEARLSFVVERDGPWGPDTFIDLITSFYVHCFRNAGMPAPANIEPLRAMAMNLVDQAFAREGGYKTALDNARERTYGGVRRVLDMMTDTLKSQLRRMDNFNANLLALDGRDHAKALAQTRYLIEKLGPFLPERFKDMPPELLVNELDTLVQLTVQTGDQLSQALRNR